MAETYDVAVVIGSLRTQAFSRKMAKTLIEVAPASLACEIVEIGDLPLYNQDLEEDGKQPPEWVRFRERMRAAQALLFITPEFNRSVPAALKNALDVGSRPREQSVWEAKPGAIVSVSPGALGAFGANHHLRQSLVFLNVLTMQQPEAYVGGAAGLFDAEGEMINESTRGFLTKFMEAFAGWVERIATDARAGR
jgi:chromate reductase